MAYWAELDRPEELVTYEGFIADPLARNLLFDEPEYIPHEEEALHRIAALERIETAVQQ